MMAGLSIVFAGTPNVGDSFVKVWHRGTKDNDNVGYDKERSGRLLARGDGRSVEVVGAKKEERVKTVRKRQSGDGAGNGSGSENARAKGYKMKFSSHPFCVSEGIPVRQEVPSRNRRKGRRRLVAEERGERTTREKNRGLAGGTREWSYEVARRAGVSVTGGWEQGNCQQGSDCIVVPKGEVERPLENLLTYGNRARLSFTFLFVAQ